MVRCSVLGCKSDGERKLPELSFHSYPRDENLRKKWIVATGRVNWKPSKFSKICSLHFMPNVVIKKKKLTLLLRNATPILESHLKVVESKDLDEKPIKTEVDHTLHLGSQVKQIDPIPGPSWRPDAAVVISGDTETANDQQTISEVQEINSPKYTPRTLERKLIRTRQQSADRLKKLKAFREKCRRLIKKVADLKNIIVALKTNSMISEEDGVLLESIGSVNKDFFKKYLTLETCARKYSPALRKLPLCLHFISSRAYKYVR